jgi:hypothetical protein
MNERIKELAEQAGIEFDTEICEGWIADDEHLERFAELIKQDLYQEIGKDVITLINGACQIEREACAKLCDEMGNKQTNQCFYDPWDCASSIRARGKE